MVYNSSSKKTQKTAKKCDFPGCEDDGIYRAPKNRDLKEYFWFCLKHVADYNKKWDFYKGLNADEIEQHLINDITWQRPTWKLGHGGTRPNPTFRDRFKVLNDLGLGMDGRYNPPQTTVKPEEKILNAARFLDLNMPFNLTDLKRRYKILAKKYHPDANQNDPDSVKRFQTLNESYHLLVTYLKK